MTGIRAKTASGRCSTGATERLARFSSRHPCRVLATWGAAIVIAIALALTSLHGLASDATVTGNLESSRAVAAIAAAFPTTKAELSRESSDVVLVTSARYAANSTQFTAVLAGHPVIMIRSRQ
jgi:uncharacterized membrane protein YdfJ with MMPL/SSD domain